MRLPFARIDLAVLGVVADVAGVPARPIDVAAHGALPVVFVKEAVALAGSLARADTEVAAEAGQGSVVLSHNGSGDARE